jgi:hypothetical protein
MDKLVGYQRIREITGRATILVGYQRIKEITGRRRSRKGTGHNHPEESKDAYHDGSEG